MQIGISLALTRARGKGVGALAQFENAVRRLSLTPTANPVVSRQDADTLFLHRHLGGAFWADWQLSTGGVSSGPYSANLQIIRDRYSFALAKDASFAGTWDPMLTSANPDSYIGGRARQGYPGTAGAWSQTITVDEGADVYAFYSARTTGTYVQVQIDGADTLVNELPTHANGYKYFDTYGAVDLTHKQGVKVASNMPAGTYTFTQLPKSDHNPSASATYRALLNGFGVTSATRGSPSRSDTKAPAWAALTAYTVGDQVQVAGRNYACTVAGTSSSTAPTHTSSTATDGTVTWTYMASSSYRIKVATLQASGSQLEWAMNFKPVGGTTYEDAGGIVHQNETLTALTIYVDDVETTLADGASAAGSVIRVVQATDVSHAEVIPGPAATVSMTHRATVTGWSVAPAFNWLIAPDINFFYCGMWPSLHWLSNASPAQGDLLHYVYDAYHVDLGGDFDPVAYEGVTVATPAAYFNGAFVAAYGDVFMPNGTSGTPPIPSALPGTHTPIQWFAPRVISGPRFQIGLATNISGADPPSVSSHVLKGYAQVPAGIYPQAAWSYQTDYGLGLSVGVLASAPWA